MEQEKKNKLMQWDFTKEKARAKGKVKDQRATTAGATATLQESALTGARAKAREKKERAREDFKECATTAETLDIQQGSA